MKKKWESGRNNKKRGEWREIKLEWEGKRVEVAEGYFCPNRVILEAIKSVGLVLQYRGIFVPFNKLEEGKGGG